jgi:hypothetical protein
MTPRLFADERDASTLHREDASRFTHTAVAQARPDRPHIEPGFEDTWYYLWRERRLPVNVDPFDSRLDDEMERSRLRRVFSRGWTRWSATCCRCRRPRPARW